nr:FAD-dependent oxidoreductase [Rhodovibrio salinarum]
MGGGFAGMFAARNLRRKLGDSAEIELINAENYFVFQPLLPEVAAGQITAPHAATPLRLLLKGVFVRKAIVHGIDFEKREITVFQGVQRRPTVVRYDHLVLALGQSTDLSMITGLSEHAMTLKTLEDGRLLRSHVIEKLEHAEITQLPEVKRQTLTFTVIGAGFSGIETVGEMAEFIDRSLKYYKNVDRSEIRIVVIEMADRALAELPTTLGTYARRKLEARGIEFQLNTGVTSASGTHLVTSKGEWIGTRTIVATIGNAPSKLVRELGLPLKAGKIQVDRSFRVPEVDNVWALGDCALIPMVDSPQEKSDYAPPTAQFAVREARHLVKCIHASFRGKPLKPFSYSSKGALASLGARRGVGDLMGIKISGFPAWLIWRAYYVAFLPGMSTRFRVLMNWLLDMITPRNVAQLSKPRPPGARHVLYHAGDRIYEKGNRADGVYTVVSGAVEMITEDPQTGKEYRRRLGPGEHFGMRLILGEDRRQATARAAEHTRVLILEREEVMKIADGIEDFRHHFETLIERELGHYWDWRGTSSKNDVSAVD